MQRGGGRLGFKRRLDERRGRVCLVEHLAGSRGGVGWLDGQVARTGLEHAEDGDDHSGRAHKEQRHQPAVGAQLFARQIEQVGSQRVAARVEIAVCERRRGRHAGSVAQGHARRAGRGGRDEGRVHRRLDRCRRLGAVAAGGDEAHLGGRHQRYVRE